MSFNHFLAWCIWLVVGSCGMLPIVYLDNGAAKMHAAIKLADWSNSLINHVSLLDDKGPELVVVTLETFVLIFLVVSGLCVAACMLLGLYHTAQWVQKLQRQRARRVKHALARGCRSRYSAHPDKLLSQSSHPLPPLSCWIPTAAIILASLALLCLCHPVLPMAPFANLPEALHHPATTLNLPPSHQPTHPQWSEPAKPDHVRWLEDFASTVSASARASRDFWTLQLPAVSNSEKQQQHPRTSLTLPADYLHWTKPNATCPNPCYGSDTHQSLPTTNDFPNMLHGSVQLCMGAVWRATSAAAPIKPPSKPIPVPLFSNQAPSTLPADPIPSPAPVVELNDSDQLAAPTDITATAVAIYRPYHAVGTCQITGLPTAVIQLPASTPTWQPALNAAEMSTAVASYQSTQQPLTSWADTFQPFTSSGSTLLLSKPFVESLIPTTRDTSHRPETQGHPITMIFTGQNMTPTAIGTHTSTDLRQSDTQAGWPARRSLTKRILCFLCQLALLSLLFFVITCFRFVDPLTGLDFEQSLCTVEWQVIECGPTNARARQGTGQTAQCKTKPLQLTDHKACGVQAVPQPVQIAVSTPSVPAVASPTRNSQQPKEQRFDIEAISSGDSRATCTKKQRLRHKIQAVKICLFRKMCCSIKVLD